MECQLLCFHNNDVLSPLQIAELMQLLADERKCREGVEMERSRLSDLMEGQSKDANASRQQLEDNLRSLRQSEAALREELTALKASLAQVSRSPNPVFKSNGGFWGIFPT